MYMYIHTYIYVYVYIYTYTHIRASSVLGVQTGWWEWDGMCARDGATSCGGRGKGGSRSKPGEYSS